MLIYEITTSVSADIAAEYEKYMAGKHIPDLLATGHFTAAFFARNGNTYRVSYQADSHEELDNYLANDAERLRADFAEHFPEGIEVTRQHFEIISLFSAK